MSGIPLFKTLAIYDVLVKLRPYRKRVGSGFMDYLKEMQLDELYVALTPSKHLLALNEVKIIDEGFNQLCYAMVQGKHHGSVEEVFSWLGQWANFRLSYLPGRYYFEGDVSHCQITSFHDGIVEYELTVSSKLARLENCCQFDLFGYQKLHSIFRTLLERHNILFIKFEFEDRDHTFELQYEQSDFDVFSALTVQYGLVYYFKVINEITYLILSDILPSNNEVTLAEGEDHNQIHEDPCAFDISTCYQAASKEILVRSEDANFNALPLESFGEESESNNQHSAMDFYEQHEPYASYEWLETQDQAKQFKKQMDWQKELIYISTPFMRISIGDEINLIETRDPRLSDHYYVLSIERHTSKGLNEGGGIEKRSSQRLTLLPRRHKFAPLHTLFLSEDNSFKHHHYKKAQPPLLLGKINGGPEGLASCVKNGFYQANLSIKSTKRTNYLRLMRAQTGITENEPYGLDFPLHAQTDVIVAMQNNCP